MSDFNDENRQTDEEADALDNNDHNPGLGVNDVVDKSQEQDDLSPLLDSGNMDSGDAQSPEDAYQQALADYQSAADTYRNGATAAPQGTEPLTRSNYNPNNFATPQTNTSSDNTMHTYIGPDGKPYQDFSRSGVSLNGYNEKGQPIFGQRIDARAAVAPTTGGLSSQADWDAQFKGGGVGGPSPSGTDWSKTFPTGAGRTAKSGVSAAGKQELFETDIQRASGFNATGRRDVRTSLLTGNSGKSVTLPNGDNSIRSKIKPIGTGNELLVNPFNTPDVSLSQTGMSPTKIQSKLPGYKVAMPKKKRSS